MVGRSSGRSVTRHPLNSTPYPKVKVCLSQELFLHFYYIYINFGSGALRGREENKITT